MTGLRFPWDSGPAPAEAPPTSLPQAGPPKPRGRRPMARSPGLASASVPSWLYHHLTISGPPALVTTFSESARGPGVVPWQLDHSAMEEDIFNLAASQPPYRRTLTIEGCRILARQFRHKVETHQGRAALAGNSQACPFDLHTLLPVPAAVLQLGATHPQALAWLRENWGTTDRLRHVALRPKPSAGRRLPTGHSVAGYGFFTDRDVPVAAVRQLQARWAGLQFVLTPHPAD